MIISDSNKFVFFHIPKTAGTSICYLLGRYGNNVVKYPQLKLLVELVDKHYPLLDADGICECVRSAYEGFDDCDVNKFYINNPNLVTWMHIFHNGLAPHINLNINDGHSKRWSAISDKYVEYFKFAFVRNPWDYAVSVFKNKVVVDGVAQVYTDDLDWDEEIRARSTAKNFNVFIKNIDYYVQIQRTFLRPEVQQCRYITTRDGECVVDHIARFEDYSSELKYIGDSVGVDLDAGIALNVADQGSKSYRDYYNQESIDHISRIFADDIERFEYSF